VSDFISAGEVGEQKLLRREYEKVPVRYCKECGCEVELSSAYKAFGLYGKWYCLNCGHLKDKEVVE